MVEYAAARARPKAYNMVTDNIDLMKDIFDGGAGTNCFMERLIKSIAMILKKNNPAEAASKGEKIFVWKIYAASSSGSMSLS